MPDATPPPAHPPVVTRFAPSPTGALHVGGARTALYAWAYARGRGGTFILRFEDTDQKRSSEASVRGILRDLEWLGIDWDNQGSEPRQSQRLDRYNAAVDQLLAAGRAYEKDGAVWFHMDRDIAFDDAVYGHVEVKAADAEDFVIRKQDGFPTFHLAVVVDDADMHVTHVIRGHEHLSNTPRHAALFDALGHPRPVFAHTPSILNPDGSKMSKRDKAKAARAAALANELPSVDVDATLLQGFLQKDNDDPAVALAIAAALHLPLPEIEVHDFRASGYLPATLCNYLALLGWNPGNDVERFDRGFLAQHFDFGRVNKGNSKFDRAKLAEFNRQDIATLAPEHFADALHAFDSAADRFKGRTDPRFAWFAAAVQPRCKVLSDAYTTTEFLFIPEPPRYELDKNVKKALFKPESPGWKTLEAARPALQVVEAWEPATIQGALERFVAERGLKNLGEVAQPLRVAISGTTVTPPIDLTLAVLGREQTLRRIDACVAWAKTVPCEPRP